MVDLCTIMGYDVSVNAAFKPRESMYRGTATGGFSYASKGDRYGKSERGQFVRKHHSRHRKILRA